MAWFCKHHSHGTVVMLKRNGCTLGDTYKAWRYDCCKCGKKSYATGGYDSSWIWKAEEA